MNMNMDQTTNMNGMGMDMNVSSASAVYTGDDPWYFRTLPGRTGDFMGHAIPGVCFAALGAGLLLVALYRARQLRGNNQHSNNTTNAGFAELHIPESDPVFLRWFGWVFMGATTVGILYEISDKDAGYDSVALTHCTMYASYFIIGVCAYWESQGRLPLDTHRAALVVACTLQSLIWYAHGSMKQLPADGALHIYLSYINGANAAVVAYSMRYTDSVIAFLAGWALILLQGLWIFLSGLYECCIDLHMHDIAAYLALVSLSILLTILVVVVYYGPAPSDQDAAKYRGNFSVLASTEDDKEYGEQGDDDQYDP